MYVCSAVNHVSLTASNAGNFVKGITFPLLIYCIHTYAIYDVRTNEYNEPHLLHGILRCSPYLITTKEVLVSSIVGIISDGMPAQLQMLRTNISKSHSYIHIWNYFYVCVLCHQSKLVSPSRVWTAFNQRSIGERTVPHLPEVRQTRLAPRRITSVQTISECEW